MLVVGVDLDQTELLGVTLGPLEVVEQGPGDIGTDVGSGRPGPLDRREVVPQVSDPVGVVDRAVLGARAVVVRRAVLGDDEGEVGTPGLEKVSTARFCGYLRE